MKSRAALLTSITCAVLISAPALGQVFERTEPVLGVQASRPEAPVDDKAAFIAQYDDDEADIFYASGSDTYEFAMLFDNVGGPDVTLNSVDVCLRQSGADPMIRYQVVVWATDGAGGTPGTELHTFAAVATGVSLSIQCDSTTLGVPLPQNDVYIGVRYNPAVDPTYSFAVDQDGIGGAVQPAYSRANESGAWNEVQNAFADANYNAMMFRAFLSTPGVFAESLVLPGFEVDTTSGVGTTTLFAVRNLTDGPLSVDVDYFETDGTLQRSDSVNLGAQETETVNIRNIPGLATDLDGFARGYVEIFGPGDPDMTPLFAGDFFQVDVGDDFATGNRLPRFIERCDVASLRFLEFPLPGSGTRLVVWIANPRGTGGGDPPSFTVQVYDEAGNPVGAPIPVKTSLHSIEYDASDFTALDFGTLRFDFTNGGGGVVFAESSVQGRFSVGLDSQCEQP